MCAAFDSALGKEKIKMKKEVVNFSWFLKKPKADKTYSFRLLVSYCIFALVLLWNYEQTVNK